MKKRIFSLWSLWLFLLVFLVLAPPNVAQAAEFEALGSITVPSGNVGVGTTTPTGALHVAIGATAPQALFIHSSSGNVGIGTTGPGAKLSVVGLASGSQTTAVMIDGSGNISTRALGTMAFTSTDDDQPDTDAEVPDAITISGGTIGSNNISGTLTTTGALTIGDGGDTIYINSSDWDISTTGVLTGISGITTNGGYTQSGTTANAFTGTPTFSNATYSALFTGGNVGIGTATPTQKLEVNGDIKVAETAHFDAEYNNGSKTAAFTLDWNNGNKQKVTITGTSLGITFTAPPGPCNLILKVVQGDGSDTLSWTTVPEWPGGTAPTLTTTSGAVDIIAFYYDGTNYYGMASLNFQ